MLSTGVPLDNQRERNTPSSLLFFFVLSYKSLTQRWHVSNPFYFWPVSTQTSTNRPKVSDLVSIFGAQHTLLAPARWNTDMQALCWLEMTFPKWSQQRPRPKMGMKNIPGEERGWQKATLEYFVNIICSVVSCSHHSETRWLNRAWSQACTESSADTCGSWSLSYLRAMYKHKKTKTRHIRMRSTSPA